MGERPYELIVAKWPEPQAQVDPHAKARARLARSAGQRSRDRRAPSSTCRRRPSCDAVRSRSRSDETAVDRLDRQAATLRALARLGVRSSCRRFAGTGAAQVVVDEADLSRFRSRASSTSRPRTRRLVEGRGSRREGTRQPRRSASPTRTSPSAPSPKRSKRRAPTMTPRPLRPNGCVRRWSGWGNRPHAKAASSANAVQRTGPCIRRDEERMADAGPTAARRPDAGPHRPDPARVRAADARLLDPPVAERHGQRDLGRPLPRRGRARRDVQRQHGHVPADRVRVRLRHGLDHPHRPGVGAARTSTRRGGCSAPRPARSLLVTIVIAIAGWFLVAGDPQACSATPGDAAPLALAYLRVIFLAMPALLLLTLLMMALRGAGDSHDALVVHDRRGRARQRPQPGLHPRPRARRRSWASPARRLRRSIANYAALIGLLVYMYARDLPLRLRGARAALPAARPRRS